MVMSLKEHRNLRHISIRELAERAEISQSTLRRIERGSYKKIKALTIQNISNALNVAPQEIEQFATFSVAPS